MQVHGSARSEPVKKYATKTSHGKLPKVGASFAKGRYSRMWFRIPGMLIVVGG